MMFDCWKNSCHGATVVPTMAMIKSTALEVTPPRTEGTTRWNATAPALGWDITSRGINSRLAKTKTNMNRSQRRKLPVVVMMISAPPAIGTAQYGLTLKYESARPTPMNSVATVKKLSTKRSATAMPPQMRP